MIIDSHHHFWNPHPYKYPWMTAALSAINRPFWQSDLDVEMRDNNVQHSIIVQTYSSISETLQFLSLAQETVSVAGVVGWVDMTDPNFKETLNSLLSHETGRHLIGIRHQVHDESDACWLERSEVLLALEAIQARSLCFDLLVRPRELPSSIAVVKRFPELTFVIDHIAKPDIKNRQWQPWAEQMAELAACDNTVCKLSGIITEADWHTWSQADVRPYLDFVINQFGADRCLFGSDWPVCLLAGRYADTIEIVKSALGDDPAVHAQVFSGTANDTYKLGIDLT